MRAHARSRTHPHSNPRPPHPQSNPIRVFFLDSPAIYQIAASTPAAWQDITKGDNSCTEGGCNGGKCTG